MRSLARLMVTLSILLTASACSDSKPPAAPPEASLDPFATGASSEPPSPANAPTDLTIGACFDTDHFEPGTSIDRGGLHIVACAEAHQHEVYAIVRDPDPLGAPFPGDTAISVFADDRCLAAFEPALGADYRSSPLDFASIRPDANAWRAGERAVICAAHDADFAELTGSVRPTSTTTTAPAAPTASTAPTTASSVSLPPESG